MVFAVVEGLVSVVVSGLLVVDGASVTLLSVEVTAEVSFVVLSSVTGTEGVSVVANVCCAVLLTDTSV